MAADGTREQQPVDGLVELRAQQPELGCAAGTDDGCPLGATAHLLGGEPEHQALVSTRERGQVQQDIELLERLDGDRAHPRPDGRRELGVRLAGAGEDRPGACRIPRA